MSRGDDEVARLRVPPHSIEAEQSVLGGLLLDNSAWDRAADLLTESDFFGRSTSYVSPQARKLATKRGQMRARGWPIAKGRWPQVGANPRRAWDWV